MSKQKLYLSHTDDGLELTREEFAEADFEKPWRYERVEGRLAVMVPPGHDHFATAERFRDALVGYKLEHRDLVEHVFDGAWTSVDEDSDRLPDLAVYLAGSSGRIPERVPELIFEIVSQGARDRRRDYEEKREEYERIGVREYVIVDRFQHRVTVLTLVEGQYQETVLDPDDVYSSPLLLGLEIPLHKII